MNQILALLLILPPAQLGMLQETLVQENQTIDIRALGDALSEIWFSEDVPGPIKDAVVVPMDILKRLQKLGVVVYGQVPNG